MTTTYLAASDAMKGVVNVAWKAATLAVLSAEAKLFFQDRIKGGVLEVGTPEDYWARVVLQHVDAGQTALGGRNNGGRRHTAYGVLWVQMFFPINAINGWRNGQQIASAVKNALTGETSDGTVWFSHPRINDNLPNEPTHTRLNVLADFQYDEIV